MTRLDEYSHPSITDPFYWHELTLILAWISNNVHYIMLHKVIYPFPNYKGEGVEVSEWISNFNP